MDVDKLERLQIILYETRKPELIKLASQLGDEKFKYGLKRPLLDKKMEKLLEYLLDPQANYQIRQANNKVSRLRSRILYNTGWFVSKSGATNFDLAMKIINAFIGTYSEIPVYHVNRDETGYHLQNIEVEKDSIYEHVRRKEQLFLDENKKELEEIHQAFLTLERVMGGDYKVNREYEALVELVCEYFGYKKKQEIRKKK